MRLDGLALALDRERRHALGADGALHQSMRRLADQHRPGLGGLLQAGGEIRRVPDRGVIHAQVVADPADHDEPGVEAHPDRDVAEDFGRGCLVLAEALLDAEGREHGTPCVILVRNGRAEQRHEAVAQKLIDGALVVVDLGQRQLEEPLEHGVHRLRTYALRQGGRVGDVAEQHRDLLALALHRALGGEDLFGEVARCIALRRGELRRFLLTRRRRHERAAALLAELVVETVFGAALGAGESEPRPALRTELSVGRSFAVAPIAAHAECSLNVQPQRGYAVA